VSFGIHVSGHPRELVETTVPALAASLIASGITAQDASLWGPAAEAEAGRRLGWVQAVSVSRPLVPEIERLRAELVERGLTRIVLAGMGGSSLAPEVIARTAGVPLVVLDATAPGQVLAAIDGDAESGGLDRTVLVVSSKSGSTVETDAVRRAFEAAFRDVGIDPAERIVVVTDPGSPLEESARAAGYRVFLAVPSCWTKRMRRSSRSPSTRPRTRRSPSPRRSRAATRAATSSGSWPTAPTSRASPTGSSSSSRSRPARTAPASCRSSSCPSRPSWRPARKTSRSSGSSTTPSASTCSSTTRAKSS
jgi:hypothetical protein